MPSTSSGRSPVAEIDEGDFFPGEAAPPVEERPVSEEPGSFEEDSEQTRVYDDPAGSLFAGPVGGAVPTSVSAMHVRTRSRGELERLSSEYARSRRESHMLRPEPSESRSRRGSTSSKASGVSGRPPSFRKRSLQKASRAAEEAVESSSEEEEARASTFAGLSALLRGRRRPSIRRKDSARSEASSRRSSRSVVSTSTNARLRGRSGSRSVPSDATSKSLGDEDEEESNDAASFGPYGSSISTNSTTSRTPSDSDSGRSGGIFPGQFVGGTDPLFGDTRIDISDSRSASPEPGLLDEEPPSNFRQPVYIPDEDLQIVFVGWGVKTWKRVLWAIACICTGGLLWLLGRWLPDWRLKGRGKTREFARADSVIVTTQHGDVHEVPIKKLKFSKAFSLATIFPPTSHLPPTSRDGDEDEKPILTNGNGEYAGSIKSVKSHESALGVDELRYIDYRYYRFLLHPRDGMFRMARDWTDTRWTTARALRFGINAVHREERSALFGSNAIEIEARSVLQILVDECLHPFYVFQIASIILWSLDDYLLYATTIAIISVASILTTLVETRRNAARMTEMSRFVCPVHVQVGGSWEMRLSDSLVPGDLVDLAHSDLQTFPADLILLSGDAIVNESMLTGESVPISKTPIEEASAVCAIAGVGGDLRPELSKHVVFSGTRIIRIRRTQGVAGSEPEAVGMVLRTGFNTTKGALVRSMLFPRPMGFKFYRDSFRFIGILAIVAFIGFLASLVNFIEFGISWQTILKRALDLVTIVVPPALPATMSIGTSFAIGRLRKHGIFCISPNRVNIGGKVNLMAFDKTGTLTEDGLDVLGVRSVDRAEGSFSDLYTDVEDVPIIGAADAKTPLLHALATCHALKLVDGEVIGDPLDLRMFEFTKWTLEEGKEGTSRPSMDSARSSSEVPRKSQDKGSRLPDRPATLVQTIVRPPGGERFEVEDALKASGRHAHFLELGVIRTFDFVSSLRRMSVLVKKLKSQSVEVYVKGAPEVMLEICDKSTLPSDYEELLASYTRHGFRVIAVAAKSIPSLTWLKAQRLKREQAESDLRFLGLIVFENKLKSGTSSVIRQLRGAKIATRMCTGDNVRTAISVARECGMISEHSNVYIPTFTLGDSHTPRSEVVWTEVEDEDYKLDSYSLRPIEPVDDPNESSSSESSVENRSYHLAVTGDAFRWILDYAALETLQRMLVKGVIFARMSPDEKHELVDRLQALGYTVGFCGDGANDCGALKAADVGLSLSEAEASVAAPFTSNSPDISCVVEVIREGRAALVTSFSAFKFMALYSLIQFATVTLLYSLASTLGDFQFLYIDLVIILPIAVTMGRTEPFTRIHPKRPSANLVSKHVLASLIGQVALCAGLQVLVFFYVRAQDWYVPPDINPDKLDIASPENSALFLVSAFQYIIVAAVFCVGPPYRQPLVSNRLLLVALTSLSAFSVYTLFATGGAIYRMLEMVELPREFRLSLLILVILNTGLSWAWETHGASAFADLYRALLRRWRRFRGKPSRKAGGKLYRAIRDDDD